MTLYIVCVKDNHATYKNGKETSFCGKDIGFQFHFVSLDQAISNNLSDTNFCVCRKCYRNVKKILKR